MEIFGMPTTPAKIVIEPVANGWIVSVPRKTPSIKKFMQDMSSGLHKGMVEGDMNDIEKLIKESQIKPAQEDESDDDSNLKRDESTFIFLTFEEVLLFLGKRFADVR
jgi:hypothetical protein